MRKWVLWGVLVLVLAVPAYGVYTKERILASGATVLVKLAPRDPRSLLQGDFMALNYALANELRRTVKGESVDGAAVVRLDANGVAELVRVADGAAPLAPGEQLLRFRKRGRNVRLASDAYYFQEGQSKRYSKARYGELKVSASGDAVLVGLRDEGFHPLGGGATR